MSVDKNSSVETKVVGDVDSKRSDVDSKWSTMDKAVIAVYRQRVFVEYISHMVSQALEQAKSLNKEKSHVFFKPTLNQVYNVDDFKMKGHIVHYGHQKPDGKWTERNQFVEGMPFRTVQKILYATHRLYLTDVSDNTKSKTMIFCLSNKFHRSERKLWHGYHFVYTGEKRKQNDSIQRKHNNDKKQERSKLDDVKVSEDVVEPVEKKD